MIQLGTLTWIMLQTEKVSKVDLEDVPEYLPSEEEYQVYY